ncbi:uncharacterized protein [Arachis hypogaea]|uniref:uncharacterized protein n=1 Tax=Arachis hypogaea TaxID=3818 RepID=UPI000DECBFC9|nr:uncharacterized protein LOC112802270 [Arachis hypogaea]QHO43155.1 uncharacterized protein DS421_5g160410 [Arachis hypogaea]
MTLEDEKRFNLYWNFHVTSPKIELKSMNLIERDIIHTLLGLWNDNPLDLRMILAEVQASKNVVVKMAGGTEAITAMRRRLGTNTIPTNTEGMDMIYSSTTHSNLSPPEPQKSTLDIEILYSHPPSSSLVRKKQKSKGKRLTKSTTTQAEDLSSYGCVLKKDFRYCDFVDSFLLTEETKSKLVEMPVEDTLPRIQKMLLRSAAFVRDVEKEILSFRSKIASKEKELHTSATQIQILNTTLASLQEDNRKLQESIKSLEEDKKTSEKKVVEIEKNNSTLAKTAENAEQAAIDAIFDAEKNILNQIKLLAPELDISSVSAFKKVMDGQVVNIMY